MQNRMYKLTPDGLYIHLNQDGFTSSVYVSPDMLDEIYTDWVKSIREAWLAKQERRVITAQLNQIERRKR